MKRLVGAIFAGLLGVTALPASAQNAILESGAKVCFEDKRLAHETEAEFQARRVAQANTPSWVWSAIDKMQATPEAMSFSFRQVGADRILLAYGGVDQNAAANLDRALRTNAPVHEVWFNSPGGSSQQGVLMGEVIRKHGVGTRVRAGDGCASACSTAFLGGIMRKVEPGAVYGVHVFSSQLDGTAVIDEAAMNDLIWDGVRGSADRTRYVQKMGIGLTWLDLWSNTHPGCMTFMSQKDLKKSFVNNFD